MTAGNSCTLQVEFAPVAVGGHGDILTLNANGLVNLTVGLHGIASGVGTKMETPLEFGTISSGSTETLLLLTIKNIRVAGDSHDRRQDQRPQLQDPDHLAEHLPGRHHRRPKLHSACGVRSSGGRQPRRRPHPNPNWQHLRQALHGLPPPGIAD